MAVSVIITAVNLEASLVRVEFDLQMEIVIIARPGHITWRRHIATPVAVLSLSFLTSVLHLGVHRCRFLQSRPAHRTSVVRLGRRPRRLTARQIVSNLQTHV